MKLLPDARNLFSRRPADLREYERNLGTPYQHIVTILLTRAIEESADAICIGFRPEVVETPQTPEQVAEAEQEMAKLDEIFQPGAIDPLMAMF